MNCYKVKYKLNGINYSKTVWCESPEMAVNITQKKEGNAQIIKTERYL